MAVGSQLSRVTLSLTGGQHEEIRYGVASTWLGSDGNADAVALHNCLGRQINTLPRPTFGNPRRRPHT